MIDKFTFTSSKHITGIMVFGLFMLAITVAAIYFGFPLISKIGDKLDRVLISILLVLTSCFGLFWGCATLVDERMFPTTTHGINENYSFTMQPYGMAFTSSQGYNLAFYQNRSLWFDQELGKIQLECVGTEAISAEVVTGHNNVNRLIVKADNATAVDTMLNFSVPFDFKRSTIYQP